jgi:hypothetical protein
MDKRLMMSLVAATGLSGAILVQATSSAQTVAADAQTLKVVDSANAFLGTLTTAQKTAASFAFTDSAQRVNWTNFPQGGSSVVRKGVRWGDMTDTQRTALMSLLGTVLSADGLAMVKGEMTADDLIRATDTGPAGGAGGNMQPSSTSPATTTPATTTPATTNQPAMGGTRPAVSFGSDYYFVSFLGTPSATSPWMLQFGGHHLAINATVVGGNITVAPSLTGGEPIKVSFNNKTYTLVPNVPVEMTAAYAFLSSLDATQRTKVVLGTQNIDLVLGPGQDGKKLQPEGLPGSALTPAQKTLFVALIKSRMNILNADDLAPKLAEIEKNLDATYFAWYGSTAADSAAYFRITGPTVVIEFAPQANDGDPANHLHNMYRDPTNDYGVAWAAIK